MNGPTYTSTTVSGRGGLSVRDLGRGLLQFAPLVAMVAAVTLRLDNEAPSLRSAAALALIASVVALVTVARSSPLGFWGPDSLFLLVIVLFHVGLGLFLAVGADPWLPNSKDITWLMSEATARAFLDVALGVSAYAIGARLVGRPKESTAAQSEDAKRAMLRVGTVGVLILSFGVAGWVAIVLSRGGVGLFVASYQTYLAATRGSLLPIIYSVISLGSAMSGLGGRRHLTAALLIGSPFWSLGFVLGLRGEVLIPLVAFCMVRAVRGGRLPNVGVALILSVALLTCVSAVKEVRQVGLGAATASSLAASPARGLAELGYSIRVVETVETWHSDWAEPYALGATYWAPFDRAISAYVFARPVLDAYSDDRLLNVTIAQREGNIGGSIIGEAVHNFGPFGMALIFVFLGAAMRRLSSPLKGASSALPLLVLGIPLLNHARNSFVQVPAQVILSAVVVWLVLRYANDVKSARHIRPSAKTSASGGPIVVASENPGPGRPRIQERRPTTVRPAPARRLPRLGSSAGDADDPDKAPR